MSWHIEDGITPVKAFDGREIEVMIPDFEHPIVAPQLDVALVQTSGETLAPLQVTLVYTDRFAPVAAAN